MSGESNVMADIMTRWYRGYRGKRSLMVRYIREILEQGDIIRSVEDDGFKMPDIRLIKESQCQYERKRASGSVHRDGLIYVRDKIWILMEDVELQMSVLVATHAGPNGHRGKDATENNLKSSFYWDSMEQDCTHFVDSCIHCILSRTGNKIPRPLATTCHADKPNEVVHFDFIYMGASSEEYKYILVIKDNLSSYFWLVGCASADAETAAEALSKWITVFTAMDMWVSDQGSHFKNMLMRILASDFKIRHHYVTAYSP